MGKNKKIEIRETKIKDSNNEPIIDKQTQLVPKKGLGTNVIKKTNLKKRKDLEEIC